MSQSTIAVPADNHLSEPTADDFAEFAAWCEEQDALQADLDQLPEPTAEEWAVHVRDYLAAHNLAAVPF
jgi:hypothetical protein